MLEQDATPISDLYPTWCAVGQEHDIHGHLCARPRPLDPSIAGKAGRICHIRAIKKADKPQNCAKFRKGFVRLYIKDYSDLGKFSAAK